MPTNWRAVFNRLWRLIDVQGADYFGGPRFIRKVQEVDGDFPPYEEFYEQRRASSKSTSRRDYFYDILTDLPDGQRRARVVNLILADLQQADAAIVAGIRGLLQGVAAVPNAVVPAEAWNADRLNEHLQGIDAAILAGDQDRAVTLSYTCLEGFYKAFYRAKNAGQEPPNDVLVLARWIKDHFRQNVPGYPDEVANQITSTASVIDRTRNRFGDAHFEGEAVSWLSTYSRDLTNTQIRLLLHFL